MHDYHVLAQYNYATKTKPRCGTRTVILRAKNIVEPRHSSSDVGLHSFHLTVRFYTVARREVATGYRWVQPEAQSFSWRGGCRHCMRTQLRRLPTLFLVLLFFSVRDICRGSSGTIKAKACRLLHIPDVHKPPESGNRRGRQENNASIRVNSLAH